YLGKGDQSYWNELHRRLNNGPLRGRWTYHGEIDRTAKIAYLQSLTVMSTPTIYRESKGLPTIEAWAAGTPVVLPNHGAFPEMVNATGGGLLHEPLDVVDLADKLGLLLSDVRLASDLGDAGRRAAETLFNAPQMATETLALYERLVGG
ncbi:MAG: glycosyltransferase family 4 protein, partial [Planctomycetales bacterium]|nr:glycosyltransferase family 4 protein [Planctomycetales bacterium]